MVEYVFDHLHFKSSDVDATARFIIDNFGGRELYRRDLRGAPSIGVHVAGQSFLIIGTRSGEVVAGDSSERRYGLDHFGFLVKDLDAAYEELRAKGVKFELAPTSLGTIKFAFAVGPDNVRVELVQRD